MYLKKILKGDTASLSKAELKELISHYLSQRNGLLQSDLSKLCICGGKREVIQEKANCSTDHVQKLDLQQKQLEVKILACFLDNFFN